MSYACPQVDVFRAGTQRGQSYSVADLDAMVRNFDEFCKGPHARMFVPAVLGHSEDQPELDRSGEPAAGWVKRLWREGSTLKADIGDIPAKFASDIKQKSYRTVSVEIYEEPPEGIPAQGMMVRRVALLGGEIPQVKGMKPLPDPVPMKFSEGPGKRFWLRQPAPLKFSEQPRKHGEKPMLPDIAALTKILTDAGVSPDAAPEVITKLSSVLESGEGEPPAAPMADPSAPAPMPTRDEMIQKLTANGEDPAALEGKSDEELWAMCQQKEGVAPMADPTPATPAVAPAPVAQRPAAPTNPSQLPMAPTKATYHFTEAEFKAAVQAVAQPMVDELRKQFAPIRKDVSDFKAEAKADKIHAFCESMRREGRLTPAMEQGVKAMLGKCDGDRVQKFGEKSQTELDKEMDAIRAWPVVVKYGEKFPKGDGTAKPEETLKAEVQQHYHKFSERFDKFGMTPDKMQKLMEYKRKHNPSLTVEEAFASN